MDGVEAPAGSPVGRVTGFRARFASWLRSDEFVDVVVVVTAIRVAFLVLGPMVAMLARGGFVDPNDYLSMWNKWDSPHILEIAERGYAVPGGEALIVLFPLMPAIVRVVSLVGSPLVLGMIVAYLATVVASIGLYRLALADGGERRVARGAVVAMSLFPTAYALIPPYTEPVFLLTSIWAFVAARRGAWATAGVLGLLAALTRVQGVFLLPALALEFVLRKRRLDRGILWLGLIALGPIAYLAINQATYGDPLFFLQVQRDNFHVQAVAPWDAVGDLVRRVVSERPDARWIIVNLAPLLALVLLAGVSIWAIVSRRSRPSYAVWSILQLGTFAILSWPISVPRYILGVFPVFLALGGFARRPALAVGLLVVSVVFLVLFGATFLQAQWAF